MSSSPRADACRVLFCERLICANKREVKTSGMDSLRLRIRIHPIVVIHQPDPFVRRLQQVRAPRVPGGSF
jgi:hypothetical protein